MKELKPRTTKSVILAKASFGATEISRSKRYTIQIAALPVHSPVLESREKPLLHRHR